MFNEVENKENLRIIKTSRNVDEINELARDGNFPLIVKVDPDPRIRSKFKVSQNQVSGEIRIAGDYRSEYRQESEGWKDVTDFTFYYPHAFELPFAAYIIPPDIKEGERVFVEDLIEDFIGATGQPPPSGPIIMLVHGRSLL